MPTYGRPPHVSPSFAVSTTIWPGRDARIAVAIVVLPLPLGPMIAMCGTSSGRAFTYSSSSVSGIRASAGRAWGGSGDWSRVVAAVAARGNAGVTV